MKVELSGLVGSHLRTGLRRAPRKTGNSDEAQPRRLRETTRKALWKDYHQNTKTMSNSSGRENPRLFIGYSPVTTSSPARPNISGDEVSLLPIKRFFIIRTLASSPSISLAVSDVTHHHKYHH